MYGYLCMSELLPSVNDSSQCNILKIGKAYTSGLTPSVDTIRYRVNCLK
jgi:hypothetical protein